MSAEIANIVPESVTEMIVENEEIAPKKTKKYDANEDRFLKKKLETLGDAPAEPPKKNSVKEKSRHKTKVEQRQAQRNIDMTRQRAEISKLPPPPKPKVKVVVQPTSKPKEENVFPLRFQDQEPNWIPEELEYEERNEKIRVRCARRFGEDLCGYFYPLPENLLEKYEQEGCPKEFGFCKKCRFQTQHFRKNAEDRKIGCSCSRCQKPFWMLSGHRGWKNSCETLEKDQKSPSNFSCPDCDPKAAKANLIRRLNEKEAWAAVLIEKFLLSSNIQKEDASSEVESDDETWAAPVQVNSIWSGKHNIKVESSESSEESDENEEEEKEDFPPLPSTLRPEDEVKVEDEAILSVPVQAKNEEVESLPVPAPKKVYSRQTVLDVEASLFEQEKINNLSMANSTQQFHQMQHQMQMMQASYYQQTQMLQMMQAAYSQQLHQTQVLMKLVSEGQPPVSNVPQNIFSGFPVWSYQPQ